jgi:hypothetical protein
MCLAVCSMGGATPSHVMVHSYHTLSIPITVLSLGRTILRHPKRFDVHTVYNNHVMVKGYSLFRGIGGKNDIQIPGII